MDGRLLNKLKIYILDFDTESMKMIANVIEINNDNLDVQYK